jgi:hypothetical protein
MRRRHHAAIIAARLLLAWPWPGPITVLTATGIAAWVAMDVAKDVARSRAEEVNGG